MAYQTGTAAEGLTNIGNYVKRLNDLFPDARVARIDKLDAIDANVVATKGSAYNAGMNSYQAAVNTATNNAASATGTLSQKLSKLIADVAALQTAVNAKGAVKSVQRGVMGGIDNINDSYSIPIATVNPAKCSVRLKTAYRVRSTVRLGRSFFR